MHYERYGGSTGRYQSYREMQMEKKKIKVLLSKIELDGHDRGVVTVGLALKDAGMEVVCLGRHQFPEQIAQAVAREDPM